MKTSKKILLTIAVILVAIWTITLFMARKDMRLIMASRSVLEYKPVPVDKFNGLDFSSNWIVTIKQGKDCKLELAFEKGYTHKPELNIIHSTLYLRSAENIHARITAPSLQAIKAVGNTQIHMKTFWSDSLTVILQDSSSFSGSKNDFSYISFKASTFDQ